MGSLVKDAMGVIFELWGSGNRRWREIVDAIVREEFVDKGQMHPPHMNCKCPYCGFRGQKRRIVLKGHSSLGELVFENVEELNWFRKDILDKLADSGLIQIEGRPPREEE